MLHSEEIKENIIIIIIAIYKNCKETNIEKMCMLQSMFCFYHILMHCAPGEEDKDKLSKAQNEADEKSRDSVICAWLTKTC